MLRETRNAFAACLVTFVLCAIAYPAAVHALGHTLFPNQANGSLIERNGQIVGSRRIAQPFTSAKYFTARPSAAGANGYAADAASGSNLATTNPALRDRIALDAARQIAARSGDADLNAKLASLDAASDKQKPSLRAEALARSIKLGEAADLVVPLDLVTTSGSGLDPEISPEAARYQAPRVAKARGLPVSRILDAIEAHTDRSAAILGAPPRVNVLTLNLNLDQP